MPAYATQSAPKQAQGNPQQQKQPKQEAPKGLAALPQGAGIAALVVMLALALPIGNFRALQNATPQAFIRQGDVKSIVEDRISAAQNAVTVAQRGSVSQTTLDDVSSAIKAMQSAKTARQPACGRREPDQRRGRADAHPRGGYLRRTGQLPAPGGAVVQPEGRKGGKAL